MRPDALPEHRKRHWTLEEIFRWGKLDWIHGFIERAYSIGMHTQGFYEINIVVSGAGWHYVESQCLPVERGDFFVIPPEIRHGYHGGDGFDVFHALVHPAFLERYGAELYALPFYVKLFTVDPLMRSLGRSAPHMKIAPEDFVEVEALMRQLMLYARPTGPTQAVWCNASALMLIAKLCALYADSMEGRALPTAGGADESFARSIALLHEAYGQRLTIGILAKAANLSRSAYIVLFKRVMGLPPGRYMLGLRLQKAKELLVHTDLPIQEITQRTGFYDVAHLCHSFAAQEGRTPLAYRRENQAQAGKAP